MTPVKVDKKIVGFEVKTEPALGLCDNCKEYAVVKENGCSHCRNCDASACEI